MNFIHTTVTLGCNKKTPGGMAWYVYCGKMGGKLTRGTIENVGFYRFDETFILDCRPPEKIMVLNI